MRVDSDGPEETGTEVEQSTTEAETGSEMNPPEAASRAELERVEETAHQKAHEEAARVHTELREEIEELRERVADLEENQRQLDKLVNAAYRLVDGLNSDMVHIVPDNRGSEPDAIRSPKFIDDAEVIDDGE